MKKILNISISTLLCLVISVQAVSAAGLFGFSAVSANTFDIVFAIDNSADLYDYDYSADNTWLEAFYGVMDQAPAGSRFGILSNAGETGLTDIASAETALYEVPLYSGTADPAGLLESAGEILSGSTKQKMVVLCTAMCYNNSELKNKIEELSEAGILIYLAAFEKDGEKAAAVKSDYDNAIVCAAARELPIRMAELYEYLVTVPQAYSQANADSSSESYKSSFRNGKHNYSVYQDPSEGGSYLAQLLNMYYLLPTYTDGYGPLEFGACIAASRGNTYVMFQSGFPQGFLDFWNNLADRLMADEYFSVSRTADAESATVAEEKIRKNLMQRYPVLIKADNLYYLITSMSEGNYYVNGTETTVSLEEKTICVLDTALYMQAYLGTPGVLSNMEFSGSRAAITLTVPEPGVSYYDSDSGEINTASGTEIEITTYTDELAVSVQTKFDGLVPQFHRTSLYYYIKLFDDVGNSLWCKEYIFDMVNRGIISGYEDNKFIQEGHITIAEFLVMLIKAADITIDTTIGEGETWAYPYLDYAQGNINRKSWWPEMTKDNEDEEDNMDNEDNDDNDDNEETIIYEFKNDHDYSDEYNPDDPDDGNYGGVIPTYQSFEALKSEDKHLPKSNGVTRRGYDNPITREFAFYLLWTIATSEECNTPNHLVEYPASDMSGRFGDYDNTNKIFREAVNNLINNNAVAGDDNGNLNPKAWITRGEMCRLFSYAMFGFDRDNNFEYPEIVNNIKTLTLEEDEETTTTGRTNEYGEGIYTFTLGTGGTGLYPISLSENSDWRLKIGVYDSDYVQLDELPDKPGYYRLFGNNRYTISVYGIEDADYTLIIGKKEEYKPQFTVSNISYNGGDGPKLGYGNVLEFDISKNTTGRDTYYAVPEVGWEEDNLYEREFGKEIELNGTDTATVTIDNIDLTSGGYQTLYTKINLYTNSTKDERLYTIDLGSVQRSNIPMPADLELIKQGGGNFLYVNNPETILDWDVIQYREPNDDIKNRMLYQQSDISGINTMYVTHSVRDYGQKPTRDFRYDIDFYNPDEDVTIKINKLFYTNDGLGYYAVQDYNELAYLYRSYLSETQQPIYVTVTKGNHKLLFKDVLGIDFKIRPSQGYLGIFMDFEVLDGKNAVVAALAAYDTQYLDLITYGGNTYANINTSIDSADFIIDGRRGEDGEYDPHRKMKGIDRSGLPKIEATLNYVVDDSIGAGNLPVQLYDAFYGKGMISDRWITNINPFNDGGIWSKYLTEPSSLHFFEYEDSQGTWNFDFKYLNPKAVRSSTPQGIKDVSEDSDYSNPILNNDVLEYFKYAAQHGVYRDDEPVQNFIYNADYLTWEDYTMMFGSWGVTHTYEINIQNTGNTTKNLKYFIDMSNYAGISCEVRNNANNSVVKPAYSKIIMSDIDWIDPNDPNQGKDFVRTTLEVFDEEIPPKSDYKIIVSVLNGVGTGGFENRLYLSGT